jgi:hypothetical protein
MYQSILNISGATYNVGSDTNHPNPESDVEDTQSRGGHSIKEKPSSFAYCREVNKHRGKRKMGHTNGPFPFHHYPGPGIITANQGYLIFWCPVRVHVHDIGIAKFLGVVWV